MTKQAMSFIEVFVRIGEHHQSKDRGGYKPDRRGELFVDSQIDTSYPLIVN